MAKKEQRTMTEKDLKAYIFTFYYKQEEKPRSLLIIAFNAKEATKLFTKWACDTERYEHINGIICKNIRRNKDNNYYFTMERYNRQNRLVYEFDSSLQHLKEAEKREALEAERKA